MGESTKRQQDILMRVKEFVEKQGWDDYHFIFIAADRDPETDHVVTDTKQCTAYSSMGTCCFLGVVDTILRALPADEVSAVTEFPGRPH